ncbi:MAG: hypothetical protein CFE29_19370 [Bradyrhizobiaceae bacterium PARB1]|jgi:K+-sensing histidine kinase KdpD|nr:MAG: hypothetical protein CFE29_19370 [Bradyrhizobiaceae bacterium PARB1]
MAHAELFETNKAEPTLGAATSAVMQYGAAFILIIFASAIAVGVDSRIAIPNVSLVYVIPVVIAGAAFGVGPSLFAAVLGALSYNFFLTEPRYSLSVDDPANIWAIALLFLVGLIVSGIAFVSNRKASEAAELRRHAEILQRFSSDIAVADSIKAMTSLSAGALSALFGAPVAIMMLREGGLEMVEQTGVIDIGKAESDAATAALSAQGVVRGGVYPDDQSRLDFWPVRIADRSVAVIGMALPSDERPPLPDLSVDVVRNLLALAIDRINRGADQRN